MVEQVAFQTVFQFLQTVGILVGVIYHIMTLRNTQKTREPSLKAKEQALDTRQQDSKKKKEVFCYGGEAIAWRAPPLFGQGPR